MAKFNVEEFVNNTAQDILNDSKLLNKFRKESEQVLDDTMQSISQEISSLELNQAAIKSQIKKKVAEEDEMVPGLNKDEARDWLSASLRYPALSFKIYTWLNVALFAVGIILFVLAAIAGLVRGEEQFSIIFGASGIASIIPIFVTNPLKRVSNAASDQSQLRIVIFSYWWQLWNLRTTVSKENSQIATANALNARIQTIMDHAVEMLQKHVEKEEKPLPTDEQTGASGKKPGK
jgi:uncharacterized protein YihD (DUF1040 family)